MKTTIQIDHSLEMATFNPLDEEVKLELAMASTLAE